MYVFKEIKPATGRMLSPDSVVPGAPGTQGYNLSAYVANNPVNWLDPTGHLVDGASRYMLPAAEELGPQQVQVLGMMLASGLATAMTYPGVFVGLLIVGLVFYCVLAEGCMDVLVDTMQLLRKEGVDTSDGVEDQTNDDLEDAPDEYPKEPRPPIPWPDEEDNDCSLNTNAAEGIPDEALVVRGGENLPGSIIGGRGVTIDATGRVHGVSVQAGTESIETLVRGHIPHGQIGITTAGEIRAAGGTIVRDSLPTNPFHCLVSCIRLETLSGLLRPTIKNPFR